MPDQPASSTQGFLHLPVLAEPLMQTLASELSDDGQSGVFVDATLGGGGHSGLLMELSLIHILTLPTKRIV